MRNAEDSRLQTPFAGHVQTLTDYIIYLTTPPESNIAPENAWLEDYFPFGMASWQVLASALLVSGSAHLITNRS